MKIVFLIHSEQMIQEKACTCTVSYAYLNGFGLFKYLQYFATVDHRVPKVIEMMSSFIQNIIDSNELRIELSSIFLAGFCLGGV